MGALLFLLLAALAAPLLAAPSAEIVMAPRVVDRQPDHPSSQYSSLDSVYCWTRVRGAAGRTIKHVWKRGGKIVREIPLKIGADDFRTWSKKDSLWPGHWTVAVEDEDGAPLGPETSFIVGDAFEAGPGYTAEIRDVSPSRLEVMLIAADTASVSAYAAEDGTIQDLLPGERPLITIRPPAIPEAQDTFDVPFQARVLDGKRAPRQLSLSLRRVPNPARLQDWAGTLRRLQASADTHAAR